MSLSTLIKLVELSTTYYFFEAMCALKTQCGLPWGANAAFHIDQNYANIANLVSFI